MATTTGELPRVWLAHLTSERYDEESQLVRRKYELNQIPCPRPATGWASYRIRCPYCEERLRWVVQNAADARRVRRRWWMRRMVLLAGTVGAMSLATLMPDAGSALFLGLAAMFGGTVLLIRQGLRWPQTYGVRVVEDRPVDSGQHSVRPPSWRVRRRLKRASAALGSGGTTPSSRTSRL